MFSSSSTTSTRNGLPSGRVRSGAVLLMGITVVLLHERRP